MEKIDLPKIVETKIAPNRSEIVIEPLFPGYGQTIGNALRRVLLSSITGAAATSFKIEGISHEFSAIPHAKEDVVTVMMNLKAVHFKSFSDEPVVLEISKKGPAEISAKDFKKNSNVEIANPDAHIITLDKSADFYMEVTIEKDRGFRPAGNDNNEIGRIAIDSYFSPVERVSLNVEDTRVGQMTNYNKLTLDITTNGTIDPKQSVEEAAKILIEHYAVIASFEKPMIANDESAETEVINEEEKPEGSESTPNSKTKIEELNLSARTTNALLSAGIKTLGGLKRITGLKLEEIKGLGKKGVDEINAILG